MTTTRLILATATIVVFAAAATAQTGLCLVPLGGSMVRVVSGSHTRSVDLDKELGGDTGSLPGDPPHTFRVLFSTRKDGFLYVVAHVRSRSPISDKNAPCGGDRPQGLVWIKADPQLKTLTLQAEIYESCSYNYYDSKLTSGRQGLTVDYGSPNKKKHLSYNNADAEKGLVITDR